MQALTKILFEEAVIIVVYFDFFDFD